MWVEETVLYVFLKEYNIHCYSPELSQEYFLLLSNIYLSLEDNFGCISESIEYITTLLSQEYFLRLNNSYLNWVYIFGYISESIKYVVPLSGQ